MLAKYVKKAFFNIFTYSACSIISRALSFLFLPFFLSKLTLEEFGIWEFYQSIFSLGLLLLTSSGATGLTRYYLLYQDDPEKQIATVGNTFLFVLISVITFFLGSLLFFSYLAPDLFSSEYLLLSIINISSFAIFTILLVFLRVKEKLLPYFIIFCTQNILATLLTAVGVNYGYGIKSFFYANLISCSLFFPLFITLFLRYFVFSFSLFKGQLKYTLPLLLYSALYLFFNITDRWIIKYYTGYETLGTYSLLWRFGSIFQFFAIAMFDAWPLILFNAQKEKNFEPLVAQLITLYCIILSTGCLFSIAISRFAIFSVFPEKYFYLAVYLPFFFLSIVFMEIAKILQSGLGLATKTSLLPVFTLMMAGTQGLLLFNLQKLGLWGVFLSNNLVFLLYSFISYTASSKIYSPRIFNKKKIITILTLLLGYIGIFQAVCLRSYSFLAELLLCCSWPLVLSMITIRRPERELMFSKFDSMIQNYFRHKKAASISQLKTILFLKTDIYFKELKGGGSHSQTLGELVAFKKMGYKILCATSTMQAVLRNLGLDYFQTLSVWPLFFFLRWKIGFLRWHADCLFSNICFTLQTKNLFKKYSIDAIYQCYSWMNFTGLLLSRLKNVPLILEYNGSEVWIAGVVEKKSLSHRIAGYLEILNLKYADFIIVISEALKEQLLKQGISEQKILINPNGVDTELFKPSYLATKPSTIRQHLGLAENCFTFGYISTFSFWHGIELLTRLIPKVVGKHKNIHFIFIGDGMLKAEMENTLKRSGIGPHVTFTGMISLREARNYLALCDAFLCPTQYHKDGSRSFYSPIKLFEYMSLAKPTLASNLEQQQEIINPALYYNDLKNKVAITNQCGILLDPENLNEWVEAIDCLINLSSSDKEKLGTNARTTVESSYTWEHHIEKIKNFVEL